MHNCQNMSQYQLLSKYYLHELNCCPAGGGLDGVPKLDPPPPPNDGADPEAMDPKVGALAAAPKAGAAPAAEPKVGAFAAAAPKVEEAPKDEPPPKAEPEAAPPIAGAAPNAGEDPNPAEAPNAGGDPKLAAPPNPVAGLVGVLALFC